MGYRLTSSINTRDAITFSQVALLILLLPMSIAAANPQRGGHEVKFRSGRVGMRKPAHFSDMGSLHSKLHASSRLRDSLVETVGYILNKRDTPLSRDQYSALAALHNALRLRVVSTVPLVRLLKRLTTLDPGTQSVLLLHEIQSLLPRFLQGAVDTLLDAAKTDQSQLDEYLSNLRNASKLADFLMEIDKTELDVLQRPIQFNKQNMDEKTIDLMGPEFGQIFAALSDNTIPLTSILFSEILLHFPRNKIAPEENEMMKSLVDTLRECNPHQWRRIANRIQPSFKKDPVTLVNYVLRLLNTDQDPKFREPSLYLIRSFRDLAVTYSHPYFEMLSPFINKRLIDITSHLMAISPPEYPEDVVNLRKRLTNFLDHEWLDQDMLLKGFVKYDFVTPIDFVIAILTRLVNKLSTLPEDVILSIKTIVSYLVFKKISWEKPPHLPIGPVNLPLMTDAFLNPYTPLKIRRLVEGVLTPALIWDPSVLTPLLDETRVIDCNRPKKCLLTLLKKALEKHALTSKRVAESVKTLLNSVDEEGNPLDMSKHKEKKNRNQDEYEDNSNSREVTTENDEDIPQKSYEMTEKNPEIVQTENTGNDYMSTNQDSAKGTPEEHDSQYLPSDETSGENREQGSVEDGIKYPKFMLNPDTKTSSNMPTYQPMAPGYSSPLQSQQSPVQNYPRDGQTYPLLQSAYPVGGYQTPQNYSQAYSSSSLQSQYLQYVQETPGQNSQRNPSFQQFVMPNPSEAALPHYSNQFYQENPGLHHQPPQQQVPYQSSTYYRNPGDQPWQNEIKVLMDSMPGNIKSMPLPMPHEQIWNLPIEPGDYYGYLIPATRPGTPEHSRLSALRVLMSLPNLRALLRSDFTPQLYPFRGMMLRAVLRQVLKHHVVLSESFNEDIRKYLEELDNAATKPRIEVHWPSLLRVLAPPNTVDEERKYAALKEFLSQSLTDMLGPEFNPNAYKMKGVLLKNLLQHATTLGWVQGDLALRDAVAFYLGPVTLTSEAATPVDHVLVRQVVISKTVNLNRLFRAMDRDSFGPKEETAFANVVKFFSEDFRPEVHLNKFDFTKCETKGKWLKEFFKFLTTKNLVEQNVKSDLETLLPFVRSTGPGEEPVEYVE